MYLRTGLWHLIWNSGLANIRIQIWLRVYGYIFLFLLCIVISRYEVGRPVMIKDEDFETPLPNVDPVSSFFQRRVFCLGI